MNLRSRWRNGKTPSSGRSGASLTTPVIISGATSPAPRAIARIRPVRMPGAAAGSTTRRIVWNFVAPERERRLAHRARHRRQRLLGGDDDDRHGEQAERQRRPEDAAGAEGRRRQALGEEQPGRWRRRRSRRRSRGRRRRTRSTARPARLLTAMRTSADEQPLLRVLAQVERGQHAERHRQHAHEDHHHHGAEDGREDAALGVRLARIAAEELPEPARVDAGPPAERQLVGRDRRGRCRASAAPSPCRRPRASVTRVTRGLRHHLAQARFGCRRSAVLSSASALLDRRPRRRRVDRGSGPRAARPRASPGAPLRSR